MESIYDEIAEINLLDPAPLSERLCKLTEEVGELATAINKINGRKRHSDSPEEIHKELLGEVADVIQNAMSIAVDAGFTPDEVIGMMKEKNQKWLDNVLERLRMALANNTNS